MMKNKLTLPLALVVAAAFSASPALAQHGNGHGNGNGRGHEAKEHARGRDDDHDDDRRDRRDDDHRSDSWRRSNGTLSRRVPPGWCIGRGNPHNTVANCGRGNNRYDRRYDPRYNGSSSRTTDRYGRTYDSRTGRYYDSRTGRYYDQYGNVYGSTSSNRSSFDAWKRNHDAQCRALARQRPLDLSYQSRVRNQCVAEERDARRRYGV
jgi:hypothetical protein